MRILLGLTLVNVAGALRAVSTIQFSSQKCGSPVLHRSIQPQGSIAGDRRTLTMSSVSQDGAGGDGEGPFTRKSLLKATTKAAGVLGAGLFVGRGFFAGVPYNGKPDLRGKSAIVTGGNTGLGKETAVRLAQLGAAVTIACRNPERASSALQDIKAQAPEGKVEAMALDLASLSSVDSFAKRYTSNTDRLDILVNNAGVMAIPERQTTKDGFEMQFGTNHLGHFRLTSLLLPSLLRSPDGRVVTVSSAAHLFAPTVNWDDLNAEAPGAYGPWSAYGLSKLSNILFTRGLQRRLDEKGASSVTCTVLHPGACRTELGRYLLDPSSVNPLAYPLLAALTLVTRSPKEGAQTQIACAAEPSLGKGSAAGGSYYIGPKITKKTSEIASDLEAIERMWAASEQLVGKFIV